MRRPLRSMLLAIALPAVALPAAAAARAIDGTQPSYAQDWTMPRMHDHRFGMVRVDRLEHGSSGDGDTVLWDADAWYGGDYRKVWITTEGHALTGESPETVELQALYDGAFSPFFSWQGGVRHDMRTHGATDVTYASIGIQGLAPQWFETDLALFLSENGDFSVRGEAEYDLRLTQRLILEPRVEVNLSADDVPELGIGRGLTDSEIGLRLRYEIMREVAPYVGVRWERLYGDSRDLARALNEPASTTSLVIGIRAWF